MSLSIKNNTSSMNTHRHLVRNSMAQVKNLERLSSGLKQNRAVESPAKLQISEQFRSHSASLKEAIDNTEMAVSVMQMAEAALDEVNKALVNARQLAVHAANTGINDEAMQIAVHQEVQNILQQINAIGSNTQFGKKYLLDGSRSGNGLTSGPDLEFANADERSKSSSAGGHEVRIEQAATRSSVKGLVPLSKGIINGGEQFIISESGRTVNFKTIAGKNVEQTLNDLAESIKKSRLNLELIRSDTSISDGNTPQFLELRHKEFGSKQSFQVASNTVGLLSKQSNLPEWIQNGLDVKGKIAGEEGVGRGQLLTAGQGTERVKGLSIRYTGEIAPNQGEGGVAGTVTFSQNSLNFQIGQNTGHSTAVSLKNVKTGSLAKGVKNVSNFSKLDEISLTDHQKAKDSMLLIDKAIEEVSSTRGEIGAFQNNLLNSNLNYLRIEHENAVGSESSIRDVDMAEEMSALTKNQILTKSSVAMMAHANISPKAILKLLT